MSTPEEAPPVDDTPGAALSDQAEPTGEYGVGTDMPWSDLPYIVGSGACMGTADVVPGVSGGTMAVALGIYQRLLAAITSIDAGAIKSLLRFKISDVLARVHWRFLVSLFAGVFVALFVMLKIVKLPQLIISHPKQVYAVFFGLVLASALALGRKLPKWGPVRAAALLLGAAVGWAVVNLVPVNTPENPLFIFLCGFVAISAMLLPGISGSFILLILGKYAFIMGSLSQPGQWPTVAIPFALGCGAGLVVFSRFLKWLMARWHDTVVAGLVGLLIGSLWRIWPYQHTKTVIVREKARVIESVPYFPESFEMTVGLLILAGILAVFAVELVASRRQNAS